MATDLPGTPPDLTSDLPGVAASLPDPPSCDCDAVIEWEEATRLTTGWVVVGISGVTCGGKTTLAEQVARVLGCPVIHQDQYFLPDDSPGHRRVSGLQVEHNDYDVLTALDMRALWRDLHAALSAPAPALRTRFLVVEGFTALNCEAVFRACRLRYYVTLPYGTCRARRALRLYSPPDVAGYFERCVWPRHLQYRRVLLQRPGVTELDGTCPDLLQTVLSDLRALNLPDLPAACAL